MGEKVVAEAVDLSSRQAYRTKLNQCLEGLGRLLAERRFDRPRNLMGLEIELNLAGSDGMPRMMNQQVLQRIASRDFQTELGMFNLEVNIVPHRLGGRVFDQLAEELRTGLAYAHRKAGEVDAGIVMIGILPTLGEHDVVSANLSDVDRYTLLNDQMAAARGEDFLLDIEGAERLVCTSPSIAPESACTSVQLHLQVTPARFADVWNAAQAITGVQIALGANAPFLFGKELWRVENRVLPAGPTVTDVIANAAFYYGLVRALAEESRPVWSRLPFEAAEENFTEACRHGIEAELLWPRSGRAGGPTRIPAVQLVLEELLPLAAAGLDAWHIEPADRDRYLGVIEERCRRRVNGASWQVATYRRALGAGLGRDAALAATTRRYAELMHAGEPVHTWPVGFPAP